MHIVECAGTPREMGRLHGEQCREAIREALELIESARAERTRAALPRMLEALRRDAPEVLEELDGVAEGAGVTPQEVYQHNLLVYNSHLDPDTEGCTNIGFSCGPDGPLWAKNNDLNPGESRPAAVLLKTRPARGLPCALIVPPGAPIRSNGANAEGLAWGSSSVGSVFQQSPRFCPSHAASYLALRYGRTVRDFFEHMTARPLHGKGDAVICVDRGGGLCALEMPFPYVQARWPEGKTRLYCVNAYLLPHLAEADRRPPPHKADALARVSLLEAEFARDPSQSLERLTNLMALHGTESGVCRHGARGEIMDTRWSAIAVPEKGLLRVLSGHPCTETYTEVSIE